MKRSNGRGGFSFVEILFAVILLGIGFILIAGVFPVAIQQSQAMSDNTIATSIARGGVRTFEAGVPAAPLVTAAENDGKVYFDQVNFANVLSDRINTTDPRYAWTPFVRWDIGTSTWRCYVIGCKARNAPSYPLNTTPAVSPYPTMYLGLPTDPAGTVHDLEPQLISGVTLTAGTALTPDQITFPAPTGTAPNALLAAPGAFVILAQNSNTSAQGDVFQLGAQNAASPYTFQFVSGRDMQAKGTTSAYYPSTTGTSSVYIVGRGLSDPTSAYNSSTNTPTGQAQDVVIYPSDFTDASGIQVNLQ